MLKIHNHCTNCLSGSCWHLLTYLHIRWHQHMHWRLNARSWRWHLMTRHMMQDNICRWVAHRCQAAAGDICWIWHLLYMTPDDTCSVVICPLYDTGWLLLYDIRWHLLCSPDTCFMTPNDTYCQWHSGTCIEWHLDTCVTYHTVQTVTRFISATCDTWHMTAPSQTSVFTCEGPEQIPGKELWINYSSNTSFAVSLLLNLFLYLHLFWSCHF